MTGKDMQQEQSGLLAPGAAGFLQFDVRQGAVAANLQAVQGGLAALAPAGPGLVVLPELWATGFAYGQLAELAGQTPRLLDELATLAGRYNILLAGSLAEATTDGIHNTLFLVDGQGVTGSYRKQQLFAPMAEDRHFTPGQQPAPMASSLGMVAGLVCYDLRFAELAKQQAAAGAGLLVVSGQWPASRINHWQVLLQARAIENQMFVVAANRCGQTFDTEFGGHSMIIAPDGEILAEAGPGPEQRLVPLDPGRITAARRRFNTAAVVAHRQADVDKVVGLEQLCELTARYKQVGRRLVFTNGCFDILHQGHVTYLEQARREGDCLIVGLNSDSSVRRQGKGADRPINDEASRARVLAALGCVDHVVLFEEDTPIKLITAVMPHVLVKGGDWALDQIVGAPEVQAAGGVVKSIPVVANFSTTNLLAKVRGSKK